MAKKIGLLFAGQGAQTVGMGKDLADEFPVAAEMFTSADAILARKLTDVTWKGPIEELTKTSNCQPALFVHGLACLAVLREIAGNFPIEAAAGLSLGEMTAHAAAGTFDFENGLKLVQRRGELMDEACAATDGAMAAMIGADENSARALAADADVDVANINSPGQIVLSGERAKIEMAVALAKEHGIRRATMLNVAGVYHSRLMESAYEKLSEALLEIEMHPPSFAVFSNVTGEAVSTLPEIRRTLQDQVTGTVRWVDCMEGMVGRGCDFFIELGPGGVLAGLLKRTNKDVEAISVSDVESARNCAEQSARPSNPDRGAQAASLQSSAACRRNLFRVAHASRQRGLLKDCFGGDAETNMRDACATQLEDSCVDVRIASLAICRCRSESTKI